MNVVIVDDDIFYGRVMLELCHKLKLNHLATFQQPLEALDYIQNNDHIDLIFLDIHMPDLSGFELLDTLSNPPMIIITTSDESTALQAFDFDVEDFLVKPISVSRLTKAINKLTRKAQNKVDHIFLHVEKKLVKVYFKDINVIEANGDYLLVKLQSGKNLMVHGTMKRLLNRLPPDIFLKVHRSYIVNMKALDSIEESSLKIGTHVIPISRNLKSEILKHLDVF